MRIRCPHCHNQIEVVDESSLSEIVCSSCGSNFSLIGSDATEVHQSRPRRLAHFELVRELGVGKFGSVWMAHDTELDRTVAIKIPRQETLDAEEAELFLRDARAAAQLKHPHIVGVHEVGREDGTVYIVSDYVEGANLKEWLSGQKLSFSESADLVIKVAEALEHAHQSGVVHRDLKPGNIMMDVEGRPHVIDFGLAKREAGEITMTVDGHILGTPAYMSPEQAKGKGHEADARSDIYSLGVILFELLTGELPFRGETQMLLLQIQRDEPPRPRKLNAKIPRDLDTITLRCMDKEPARRYRSAGELAADLNRFLSGEPIHARPVRRVERLWRWSRRNPLVASLSSTAAVLLVLVAVVSMVGYVQTSLALAREENARRDAETEKQRADDNKRRAEANADQQRVARADATRAKEQAQANLEDAVRERDRAERNLLKAREAVDNFYTLMSENTLLNVPSLHPLRKELLEAGMEFYEGFLEQKTNDPALLAEIAASYIRFAEVANTMGLRDERLPALTKGVEIVERLLAKEVDLDHFRRLRDVPHPGLRFYTGAYFTTAEAPKFVAILEKATGLWEELVRRFPESQGFRSDLAQFYFYLGIVRGNDVKLARQAHRKSLAIFRALAAEHPKTPDYTYGFVVASNSLALSGLRSRQLVSSIGVLNLLGEAVSAGEQLVNDHPDVADYRVMLACGYIARGGLREALGRSQDALKDLEEAAAMARDAVEQFSNVPFFQEVLVQALTLKSRVERTGGQTEAADKSLQEALVHLRETLSLLNRYPEMTANRARDTRQLQSLLRSLSLPAEKYRMLLYAAHVSADPSSPRWVASGNGLIKVFEQTRIVAEVPLPPGRTLYSAFGPDGSLLVLLSAGGVEVNQLDLEDNMLRQLFVWNGERAVCLAVGPQLPWPGGGQLWTDAAGRDAAASFSSDLAIFLGCGSVSGPGSIVQIDGAGSVLGAVSLQRTPYAMAISKEGLVAVCPSNGQLVAIDRNGSLQARTLPKGMRHPIGVAVSPPNGALVIGDNDRDVIGILPRSDSDKAIVAARIGGAPDRLQDLSVAVTSDGSLIYGTSSPAGVYRIPMPRIDAVGASISNEQGDSLTILGFDPPLPAVLAPGDRLSVNIGYKLASADECRIFARPYSGGARTPGYGAHPSPAYEKGEGTLVGWFEFSADAQVDEVRVAMRDGGGDVLSLSARIDVGWSKQGGSRADASGAKQVEARRPVLPDLQTDVLDAGAFAFPQPKAIVLCNEPGLRFSVWNNDSHLFLQAVVWRDNDRALGQTDDGRQICDQSTVLLDLDADQLPTKDYDRAYHLNPWPKQPGMLYTVQVSPNGTTALKDDSRGRGAIRYVRTAQGEIVRVDSFLIPLDEIKKQLGGKLRLAYWGSSTSPKMLVNSVGYNDRPRYYSYHLPRDLFHEIKLFENDTALEANSVPRGRDDKQLAPR